MILIIISLLSAPPSIVWTALPETDLLAVETVSDVNGNGTEDVVASPHFGSGSGLYCVDGLTGETLWTNPEVPGVRSRICLCSVPDLNGDGIRDLAVSTGESSGQYGASVLGVSGWDGSVIWATDCSPHEILSASYSRADSGGAPIVHAFSMKDGSSYYFLGLDGADGDTLWTRWEVTTDPGLHPVSDISGNGWGDLGISVDRGSVTSGWARVIDGINGLLRYETYTCYFGRMDVCDTPEPIIAVGHEGLGDEELRLETVPAGDTLYLIPPNTVATEYLQFADSVQGGELPFPVLMGWDDSELSLVCGYDGLYGTACLFDQPIQVIRPYQSSDTGWTMAVLTLDALHLTEPALFSPQPGPSVGFGAADAGDLCLAVSEPYPTPLACVAFSGFMQGLRGVSTSWPESVEEGEAGYRGMPVSLTSNPAAGGIGLRCGTASASLVVFDLCGRRVAGLSMSQGEEAFVALPPGVYLVAGEEASGGVLRAAVLPAR